LRGSGRVNDEAGPEARFASAVDAEGSAYQGPVSGQPYLPGREQERVTVDVPFGESTTFLIEKEPDKFNGKLITDDSAGEGFGYGLNWYYTKAKGEQGWKALEAIGSAKPKLQTSGGKIIDAVVSGEALLGFFVSNITVQPRLAAAEQILGYAFVPDAQIVAVRPMAVTKRAKSPNSAKLLLDYILSSEGQLAFANGGLTAYRSDVAEQAKLHIAQVSKAVGGDDKLIFVRPEAEIADEAKHKEFIARWEKALQIQR
jgi:iron(III) transport system substrate-binding protein